MLPVRDAETTLEAAARSCLAQTFGDFELILIENQATAGTRAVVRRLLAEDGRVRVLSAPDFIPALNLAWTESRGGFLARMDADDLCLPDRIARQVEFLEQNPDLAACASLVRIRRRGADGSIGDPQDGYAVFEEWLNSVVTPGEIAAQRFVDSPIANPSAMIRREVFDQIGGYRKVDWAEDYDFWLRLLEAGARIGKAGEQLLDWFDSDFRLTRTDEHYSQTRFLQAKAHFLARLPIVRERGVAICGAGPIGKRLGRLLRVEGVEIQAFFDVSERRIGNEIGGVRILGNEALPLAGRPVLLGAVGLRGARERVRDVVLALDDYAEGRDFFCVA